jgi:hypothetical protein
MVIAFLCCMLHWLDQFVLGLRTACWSLEASLDRVYRRRLVFSVACGRAFDPDTSYEATTLVTSYRASFLALSIARPNGALR